MRKILTAGMAALTLVGSLAASATPAAADSWRGHHRYYGHHGGNATGSAIAGGILGFALGAAVGSSSHHGYYDRGGYYGRPYYGRGYYDGGYYRDGYYRGGYTTCVGRREVWDPYIGDYVIQRYTYAC